MQYVIITKPASSRDIRAAAAGAIGKDRAEYRFTSIGLPASDTIMNYL